ncbi:MAG: DUF308 domain-containing protein [Woeseiaceae bacterium]|nr:DUF308 domain-containing protein [Woeseiaceae bacterium]
MQEQDMLQSLKGAGKNVQLTGAGLIVLGVLSIWSPDVGGMAISVLVGLVLLFGGVLRTMFAWLSPGWGSLFAKALVGIITILAGVYMIFNPSVGSKALAVVLTFYLFVDGITTLVFAIRMPPVAGGAWMMFGAVVSILAGVLMYMQWPASGELAIGILIGVKLLIDGVVLVGIGQAARSVGASSTEQ